MFVTDVICQIGWEKANKCIARNEGWSCIDSKQDKITVALVWTLPPPNLNIQKQSDVSAKNQLWFCLYYGTLTSCAALDFASLRFTFLIFLLKELVLN